MASPAARGEHPSYGTAVIHQHPLAYLLGLEGVALMKAFAGEYDRGFTHARIAELLPILRTIQPGWSPPADVRGYFIGSGLTALGEEDPQGNVGYIPSWSHPPSAYLQAALPYGFVVRDCRELPAGPAWSCGTSSSDQDPPRRVPPGPHVRCSRFPS